MCHSRSSRLVRTRLCLNTIFNTTFHLSQLFHTFHLFSYYLTMTTQDLRRLANKVRTPLRSQQRFILTLHQGGQVFAQYVIPVRTSAPVSSQVDERRRIGRLASSLLMHTREASAILARNYCSAGESSMSRSSHFPSTEKLVATSSHERKSSRDIRGVQENTSQLKQFEKNNKKLEISKNSKQKKQSKENMKPYQDAHKQNFIRSTS